MIEAVPRLQNVPEHRVIKGSISSEVASINDELNGTCSPMANLGHASRRRKVALQKSAPSNQETSGSTTRVLLQINSEVRTTSRADLSERPVAQQNKGSAKEKPLVAKNLKDLPDCIDQKKRS